jgi:ribosome-associated translation inhibitor RaiA
MSGGAIMGMWGFFTPTSRQPLNLKGASMQVQVNTDDHIQGGESLAQWITDESKSRLSRFQDHVTRLEVFLSDLDAGKSGANDKRCRIEARVTGRQPITVTDEADKMANAFIGAVDKLARALDTDLGRAKDRNGRDTIRAADAGE